MNQNKPLEWAIRTVRNEAEDILGWAKQALYFCDHVVVIIDPLTTDNTAHLLKAHYPEVRIEWQDRTMGDSDNTREGPTGNLYAHLNQEYWINRLVKNGQWFLQNAPDERFHPDQWSAIADEIRLVRRLGLADGIAYKTMWQFYPDFEHVIDFYSHFQWWGLLYFEIWKKDGPFHKNGPAHSGHPQFQDRRWWWSLYPFYHYCWVKNSRKCGDTWRDKQYMTEYPLFFLSNSISNWRTLKHD